MSEVYLCKTEAELRTLVEHFYEADVWRAMVNLMSHDRMTLPELMKRAAYEAFLRPELFDNYKMLRLRQEILYLEEELILHYANQ